MKKIVILLIFLFSSADAGHIYPEKYYQNLWCGKWHGKEEVKLIDDTRVDCVTKNYAVEFDFAPKWAEAIGQSLHYARMTGKKPAIILIIETGSDFKYYNRIKPLCEEYNIALWYMKSDSYKIETESAKNINFEDFINLLVKYVINFIDSIV